MKATGEAGSPSLTYNPESGEWDYKNGCVCRYFTDSKIGKKKVDEFNKHPERHDKFYSETGKVLGVDVSYDAWEKPEVTYSIGDWFKNNVGDKGILAIIETGVVCLINENGRWWSAGVKVEAVQNITEAEIKRICGTSYTFTPIKVKIEEMVKIEEI